MSFTSLPSSAAQSLRNALGFPSTRIPIDVTTFVSYVLPPLVCYLVAAVLAVTSRTRTIRVAICPLAAFLALRAALSVDMSLGRADRKSLNLNLVLFFFCISVRIFDWALAKGPLVRHIRPANGPPSTLLDALDLASNFRGYGWEWSRYRSYTPRETRPANRIAFVFYAFVSAVAHALICGALHRAVLSLTPLGDTMSYRSTIFDETLPFLVRHLRATLISTFTAFAIYAAQQTSYDFFTVLAVLILRQDPAQWPPIFDAPWRATSLSSFWGRRWHQLLRHTFLFLGSYPLPLVLGRAGITIGAFLASALVHHIGLIVLNSQTEIWWMLAGFGMMGPGVLAERAFYRLTRKRVGGIAGWVWTMAWLALWGNVIVEGFTRAGLFASMSSVDGAMPIWIPAERLAEDFDVWLHSRWQGKV